MNEELIELEKEEMIYNILEIGEVKEGEALELSITGKEPNQKLNFTFPRKQSDDKDYETQVFNKPSINDVELIGNKTLEDLGIQPKGNYADVEDTYTKNEVYNKTEVYNKNETYAKNEIENKLETLSNNVSLNCYSKTLIVSNWVLNETTNIYEYNATNENITEKHIITIDADIINRQKFTGIGSVKSYNGGFKIEATELPESDIEITVVYQLSTLEVREPINEEVTEEVVENAG